jgi:hypothetical protein
MTDTPQDEAKPQTESSASGMIKDAQSLVSTLATTAQDTALRMAEEQKAEAADRVEDVARTLDSAADQVERILPGTAPYLRDAAAGIQGVSSAIRDQSIEEIVETVMEFARQRPGTFFAGSALAGFVLARFLKSSAEPMQDEVGGSTARQLHSTKRSGARAHARTRGAAAAGNTGHDAEASAAAGTNRSS